MLKESCIATSSQTIFCILLSGGVAAVTDFGIAKAIVVSRTQTNSLATGLTQAGTPLGTPAYMAAERALGDPGADYRADIYAWRVVAWELLGGAHPYAGRSTVQALIAAHIAEPPPSLAARRPEVPAALTTLVMRCLEKAPTNRPASAGELLAAVESVNTSREVIAQPPQRDRRRMVLTVAAAAVVVAIASGVIAWRVRAGALSIAPDKSLAVLPFAATNEDTANAYLAEVIADEVTNTLDQVPGLRLAGRISSARLAAKNATAQDTGSALNVGTVPDGTVRREGNRISVTAELFTTSGGTVLWHDSYNRAAKDVFTVQDEIARAMAGQLQVTLSDPGTESPAASGTRDATAYGFYLKGT